MFSQAIHNHITYKNSNFDGSSLPLHSSKRLKAESQQLFLGKKNGTQEEKGRKTTIFEQEKKQMHTTMHR